MNLIEYECPVLSSLAADMIGIKHTRIIKLSSLTDTETTTTNNQHLLHIDQISSSSYYAAVEICLRIRCLLGLVPVRWQFGESSQLSVQRI